ncbi:hypothetical protein HK096_003661, partial [Nowakowskiella sp. JEL0078]
MNVDGRSKSHKKDERSDVLSIMGGPLGSASDILAIVIIIAGVYYFSLSNTSHDWSNVNSVNSTKSSHSIIDSFLATQIHPETVSPNPTKKKEGKDSQKNFWSDIFVEQVEEAKKQQSNENTLETNQNEEKSPDSIILNEEPETYPLPIVEIEQEKKNTNIPLKEAIQQPSTPITPKVEPEPKFSANNASKTKKSFWENLFNSQTEKKQKISKEDEPVQNISPINLNLKPKLSFFEKIFQNLLPEEGRGLNFKILKQIEKILPIDIDISESKPKNTEDGETFENFIKRMFASESPPEPKYNVDDDERLKFPYFENPIDTAKKESDLNFNSMTVKEFFSSILEDGKLQYLDDKDNEAQIRDIPNKFEKNFGEIINGYFDKMIRPAISEIRNSNLKTEKNGNRMNFFSNFAADDKNTIPSTRNNDENMNSKISEIPPFSKENIQSIWSQLLENLGTIILDQKSNAAEMSEDSRGFPTNTQRGGKNDDMREPDSREMEDSKSQVLGANNDEAQVKDIPDKFEKNFDEIINGYFDKMIKSAISEVRNSNLKTGKNGIENEKNGNGNGINFFSNFEAEDKNTVTSMRDDVEDTNSKISEIPLISKENIKSIWNQLLDNIITKIDQKSIAAEMSEDSWFFPTNIQRGGKKDDI